MGVARDSLATMGFAKDRSMELQNRDFDEVPGNLCVDHLSDTALRELLTESVGQVCAVCGESDRATVLLDDLVVAVKEAVDWYFGDPVSPSGDGNPSEPDAVDVIGWICADAFDAAHSDAIIDRIAGALVAHGGFATWPNDRHTFLEWRWYKYTRFVRETVRFVFGAPRGNAPREVAELLEDLTSYLLDSSTGLLQRVPLDLRVFRGRLAEDASRIPPDADALGPPPIGKAAANRMSPAGISLFYGSEDPQTAIAEIAGHGPEPFAVIGEFRTTRALHILDFTQQASQPGSVFDPSKREAIVMHSFLQSFVDEVTRPVIPDGREHVEYAPTQVLTEYLRWTSTTIVDGIAFPSAANPGKKTYVLFYGRDEVADSGRARDNHVLVLDPGAVNGYDVKRSYRGLLRPGALTAPQRCPTCSRPS